ncbi:MAG: stalk domain-containing protein [Oscillospiraceae bacterium]|nr:stalk domain-containing protein [Oscillospiraceae bacterium]
MTKLQKGKYFILGVIATIIVSTFVIPAVARLVQETITVHTGINVYVDGRRLNMRDAQGNRVEAGIFEGTTYLPVRAIAEAFGTPIYWDGPTWTVFLGSMDGRLQHPTTRLDQVRNIAPAGTFGTFYLQPVRGTIRDNYGNSYNNVFRRGTADLAFRGLLNMRYSRFRGTIFIPQGTTRTNARMIVEVDGRIVYTSPTMTESSRPIDFDINITGGNDFRIRLEGDGDVMGAGRLHLAEPRFYQ